MCEKAGPATVTRQYVEPGIIDPLQPLTYVIPSSVLGSNELHVTKLQ